MLSSRRQLKFGEEKEYGRPTRCQKSVLSSHGSFRGGEKAVECIQITQGIQASMPANVRRYRKGCKMLMDICRLYILSFPVTYKYFLGILQAIISSLINVQGKERSHTEPGMKSDGDDTCRLIKKERKCALFFKYSRNEWYYLSVAPH